MLSGQRVLVIEGQFLVALDIQRVLEEARAQKTVFARSIAEAARLEGRFDEFDVALVETSLGASPALELMRKLRAAGVAVVATTSDATSARHVPGLPEVPLVVKPVGDLDLLTACTTALARRRAAP